MRIDIFHDIACPWCRIGKAHLALALEQWQGKVDIHYHPFFLNADIADGGEDFQAYMLKKGGYRVELEQFFSVPREIGAKLNIPFNFEAIEYAPNTLLAHRLVSFFNIDEQATIIEALYKAYFEDGRNVGDIDILSDIAYELGHDKQSILVRLQSEENYNLVLAQVKQAQQLGIQGVPFFVFNNLFSFSGAQPPETILNIMKQANTEQDSV